MMNFKTDVAAYIFSRAVSVSRKNEREFFLTLEELGVSVRSNEFQEGLNEIHEMGCLRVTMDDFSKIQIFIINEIGDVFD